MATRKTPTRSGARKATSRTAAATRSRTPARSTSRARPERDSHGRFKADHHVRNAAFGATAAIGAVAAGVAAAFKFGLLDRFLPAGEGHSAEDLLIEDDADQAALRAGRTRRAGRAPAAFRPDMDASLSKADKAALRPARGTPAANLAAADNGVVEEV